MLLWLHMNARIHYPGKQITMSISSSLSPQMARPIALAVAAIGAVAVLAASVLGTSSPGSSVITTQQFFYLLGHLSFAATFFAYAQRSLARLRLIASLGLALGLLYNGYVHLHMPEGQNMFPSLFWLSVFLVQNISKSIREAMPAKHLALPANEEALRRATFPSMSTHDWAAFAALADKSTLKAGECLLLADKALSSLQVLVSGDVSERISDQAVRRTRGTLWGALPWAVGADAVSSAPARVTATAPGTEVWSWSYAVLDQLAGQNASLGNALKDGILRSACREQGLLKQN